MCEPTTIIMMSLAAAQGAATIKAQKEQAKAQEKAQNAASVREMKRQQMSMRSERMQQGDEETTIAEEQLKANVEAESAISTTTVAGEAAGVSGISAGLSIQDYERKNAEYQGALANQTRMNDSARRLSLANSGQQYVGNMANINKDIAQPDYLGVGLQTASGMTSAYQQGSLASIQKENATLSRDAMRAAQGVGAKATTASGIGAANAGIRTTSANLGVTQARGASNMYGQLRIKR